MFQNTGFTILIIVYRSIYNENNEQHIVGTIPKSSRQIVEERGKIDTPNTSQSLEASKKKKKKR